jgi:hypothetical protein
MHYDHSLLIEIYWEKGYAECSKSIDIGHWIILSILGISHIPLILPSSSTFAWSYNTIFAWEKQQGTLGKYIPIILAGKGQN